MNKQETTTEQPFDAENFCMAYEDNELSPEEVTRGFQKLIDTGLAWKLQGFYGRAAAAMIRQGLCKDTHHVLGGVK
jgi:hypothetical protein